MTTTPNAVVGKLIRGAAIEYTEKLLGGPVVENESYVSIGTSLTVAIDGAGDRVGLVIVNQAITDVYIGTRPDISATQCIRLTGNGGSITLNVHDDFTLPTRRWYAISATGTVILYVLEILRFTRTLPED
jgi:hypothetical protein